MSKLVVCSARGRAEQLSLIALCVLALLLAACGDATCPAGSESSGDQCVPAISCGKGLVRKGNSCELRSGVSGGDAGGAESGGDGSHEQVPDGGRAPSDSGMHGGSSGSDAAVEPPAEDAAQAAVPTACDDYDCGANGHCEVVAGAPRCACDQGFAGERCDACEPGLGLSAGGCVPACEADDAPDCGAHGQCEIIDGAAQCTCEHPAAGDLCAECAEGFALQSDGSCAPDCGDCGPHGYCDGSLRVPACACYAGYALGTGSGCAWAGDGVTGGIVNGEFTDATGWETRNVAIAGGAASFAPSGSGTSCELGVLSQTIKMPTRAQSEQFVLELDTTTSCTDSNADNCPPLLVELGSSVMRVRVPGGTGGASATQKVCLGDAVYGDALALRIRPGLSRTYSMAFACESDTWPAIRAVRVAVAGVGQCSASGEIPNGSFAGPGSWTLADGATIAGGSLHLTSYATARTAFAVPMSEPAGSPALLVVFGSPASTNQGPTMQFTLDGLTWQLTTFESGSQYFCLPDWTFGTVHELGLKQAASGEPTIDGMTIDMDSRCGDGSFDSGFERPLATGSWSARPELLPDATEVINDSREALSGNSALRAHVVVLNGLVRVPDSTAGGHAAITVAYRLLESPTQAALLIGGMPPFASQLSSTVTATTWTRITPACAGHAWDGQLVTIAISTSARFTDGRSDTAHIWFDEAEAVSSPQCP